MQFHILDENYIPVAVMDNELPESIHYQKSKFHQFLTGSANFFDFETSKLHVDSDKFQVGYWIAFRYDDRDRLLYIDNIAEAERDKMMTISSISDNLDLNNETIPPFAAPEAKPFKWYFDKIMFDTGYEIGINEISNLTRKISWDSEMTIRNFIQSVATQFDNAELDYEVQLNSDFTVKKRLIHIKKKIGEVRDDIELRYNENIKTIKRTTSTSGLYTAIRPVSRDNNDKIIDISSMPDWEKKDENGNVKFFHKKGSTLIFAPQANARFGNRGANITGGGYIVYDFSHDNISQSELFNRAAKYLEDHSVPAVNYLVEGKTDAKIGDTVKMVNDGYTPQLLTSARVLEKVASFDDDSIERAEFGNYKALQSQISDDLIAKMQKLAEENAPYKATTLTTNGLTFKNSQGSTVLTARLFKGTKEIIPDSYIWTKDDVALSVAESTLTVDASNINVKSVVRWSAVINGVTVAFDEVTITDVSDGTITHTAWSYSSDGTDGFTTVYPNLNLFKNTKSQSYTSTGTAENISSNTYTLDGVIADLLNKPLTITYDYAITNSSGTWSGTIRPTYGLGGANQSVSNTNLSGTHKETITLTGIGFNSYRIVTSGLPAGTTVTITNLKVEFGSTATPYMSSSSEVTTDDWPKYRGEYSDISSEQSIDPSKYTWGPMRGNDGIAGNDGVGINSTTITYAISTSGTTAPSTGWTSSVPSLVKGQYLWTKTVWTYTDNSSETGYSVTYISKDGNNGTDGLAGKDGVGINNTTITYAGSANGTTAPTTGYTTTVPSVPAGQFLWTKTVWTYTDNTSETGYSVAMMGLKGERGKQIFKSSYESVPHKDTHYWSDLSPAPSIDNPPKIGDTVITPSGNILQIDTVNVSGGGGGGTFGVGDVLGNIKGPSGTNGTSGVIVSSVAPASPQNGQLWQDTSTTPQLVKKWTGSEWIIWELYAQNLIADSISAISSNLGNITAGTYTSWSIEDYDVYDYLSAIYLFKGGIRFFTIENPNTTNPDTSGVAAGKMIRGMSIVSGMMQFYQQLVPSGDIRTANEILKEVDGFWTPYSEVGGYCGSISSYKYSDGSGQLTLDADSISVVGELKTNAGTISNSSSRTVALFYGLTVVFRRQGNLVIASITRQRITTATTGEDLMTNEKVPSGYRPSYSHYFGINRNSGTNILKDLVMGIASNGDVRVTIGETGTAMFTGSTSYFTTDPLP